MPAAISEAVIAPAAICVDVIESVTILFAEIVPSTSNPPLINADTATQAEPSQNRVCVKLDEVTGVAYNVT